MPMVVGIYNSCGGSVIACGNPQFFTYMSQVYVIPGATTVDLPGLVNGTTYYVQVYNFDTSVPVGSGFSICVTTPPSPPANDICSNAVSLTVGNSCVPTTGTVGGAIPGKCARTAVAGVNISPAAKDVWYTFTASQAHTTTEVASSTIAPVVIVYDACGGNIVDCMNPTVFGTFAIPGTTQIKATNLSAGHTYFVRVYNYGATNPTNSAFTICVFMIRQITPANDDCSGGAIAITAVNSAGACTYSTQVNTNGATQSTPRFLRERIQ